MAAAALESNKTFPAPDTPLQFVCAELWGGNRQVHVPVTLPGLRGVLYSQPCDGGRGGDIHYLSVCHSGVLTRVCVADVAGHGESVARVGGEIHRQLRRYMNTADQRRVLQDLNNSLTSGSAAVTTAALISYYPPQATLSVSYAGHPPAWLFRRATGAWGPLEVDRAAGLSDLPLAAVGDVHFSRRNVSIAAGDRLLILTDGVLEAPGRDGLLFGTERLAATLAESAQEPIDRQLIALRTRLEEHTGGALNHDDVTILLVEFLRGPRLSALWLAIRNRFFPRSRPAVSGV